MKLNALRDFLAVAERGGVRAAARHLGLAQPAISAASRNWKELGAALFERHAKGVQLTPVGQAFLRRATAIHHEIQRARDEAGQLRGAVNGRVTLGMSTAPHLELFPDVLPAFRARFPDIHLEIVDGVYPLVEGALLDGSMDFYVGPAPARVPGELRVEKLFDNTRVILGRKGHPLAQAKSLRELAERPLDHHVHHPQGRGRTGPAVREAWPARAEAGDAGAIRADLPDGAAQFGPADDAAGQWLRYPLLRDTFQEIKVREKLPAPPVCIVQRTGLPLTPAAEHYCTLLRRAARHIRKR